MAEKRSTNYLSTSSYFNSRFVCMFCMFLLIPPTALKSRLVEDLGATITATPVWV